jgi:hypothetical protein
MLASRRRARRWRVASTSSTSPPALSCPPGVAAARRARHRSATGQGSVLELGRHGSGSPWRGVAFKGLLIDIYSHKLVGCRVRDREVDTLAVRCSRPRSRSIGPTVRHADSGRRCARLC